MELLLDAFGVPLRSGEFVLYLGRSSHLSYRRRGLRNAKEWGRVISCGKHYVKVSFVELLQAGAALGTRRYIAPPPPETTPETKTYHLRVREVRPDLCVVFDDLPGIVPGCGGCGEGLVLDGYPENPVWLCTNKHCGAMFDWNTPLQFLFAKMNWHQAD